MEQNSRLKPATKHVIRCAAALACPKMAPTFSIGQTLNNVSALSTALGYRYSLAPNRDGPLHWRQCRSLAIEITTRAGDPISPRFWTLFAYTKIAETRTRDRMYGQTVRTVRDISQDNRARIATCSLRTPTDRQTDLRRIIV